MNWKKIPRSLYSLSLSFIPITSFHSHSHSTQLFKWTKRSNKILFIYSEMWYVWLYLLSIKQQQICWEKFSKFRLYLLMKFKEKKRLQFWHILARVTVDWIYRIDDAKCSKSQQDFRLNTFRSTIRHFITTSKALSIPFKSPRFHMIYWLVNLATFWHVGDSKKNLSIIKDHNFPWNSSISLVH